MQNHYLFVNPFVPRKGTVVGTLQSTSDSLVITQNNIPVLTIPFTDIKDCTVLRSSRLAVYDLYINTTDQNYHWIIDRKATEAALADAPGLNYLPNQEAAIQAFKAFIVGRGLPTNTVRWPFKALGIAILVLILIIFISALIF